MPHVLFVVLAAVLFNATPSGAVHAQAADESERLEALLDRLGLVELQLTHLERQIVATASPEARLAIAQRLADVLAVRVLQTEDEQELARLDARIERLLRIEPRAGTGGLAVARLQADFQRAEKHANAWLDGREPAERDAALAELLVIGPRLEQQRQELVDDVARLSGELDRSPTRNELATAALERRLQERTLQELRATFLSGWIHYYLGVLPRQAPPLVIAAERFRALLGLAEGEQLPSAEELGLEALGRARSLIGLGLVAAAQGDLELSRRCFELLADPRVDPTLRDQAGRWRLQALLNADQADEAFAVGKQLVGELPAGEATVGRAALCKSLIDAGYRQGGDPRLGPLGIAGLARLREYKLLRELLERHHVPLDGGGGFHLQWLRGQQLLEAARKSGKSADYLAAAEQLRAALGAPDAQGDLQATGQCRSELGWSLYHGGRPEEAAREYEQAAAAYRASAKAEEAARALWMAAAALQQAAKSQPALKPQAARILEKLRADYPESSYAQRAEFQLTRLQAGEGDDAALLRVGPDDPNFVEARWELLTRAHRQWSAARGEAEEPTTSTACVRQAEQFLDDTATRGDTDPTRRLRAALLGLEAALDGRPALLEAARRLVGLAGPLANGLPLESPLRAEFVYRAMRTELAAGRIDEATRHAAWLGEHGAGGPFERQALLLVAKGADDAVAAAEESERPALVAKARASYERLVGLLGDDLEMLSGDRNAQVALYRLATYELESDAAAAAAPRFARLLEVAPKSRPYLRGAALAAFAAGDARGALEHWRTLLKAAPADSPDWFEAKYYQLACLAQIDKAQALQVYQQFKALYPEPPEPWRAKFAELAAMLAR